MPIVGLSSNDDRGQHSDDGGTVRVRIASHADIVVARQRGRALAKAMKFSATDSAFIATTVSELARALLTRTLAGEISLHKVFANGRSGVVIVARAPMAPEMRRSAVTSDLALPDVCRLVDDFVIVSDGTDGTTIRATKWCQRQ